MKKLKVYYTRFPNLGDRLNTLIIEKLFGYSTVRRTPLTCRISAIGSGLGNFCYSGCPWLKMAEYLTGLLCHKTYIWGTGFIDSRTDRPFYRRQMVFCAVRGRLSKERAEKILGENLGDIPTADGGILADALLDTMLEKRYAVGIIPHFRERQEPAFRALQAKFDRSVIIDLRDDPIAVIRQIAACETVISSSLHGLVVADSLHIPNIHVKVSDKLRGDGFKFDDYYSGYGITHRQFRPQEIPDPDFIVRHYEISAAAVEEKKAQMKACFPYPAKHPAGVR